MTFIKLETRRCLLSDSLPRDFGWWGGWRGLDSLNVSAEEWSLWPELCTPPVAISTSKLANPSLEIPEIRGLLV